MKYAHDMASIGAALCAPARADILCVLMEGRAFPNKELASHVGVTPQTVTGHLDKLQAAGLTSALRSGRHIYHRIASEDVAAFLEHAANMAPAGPIKRSLPKELCAARCCYSHLAGQLGVALAEALRADGRITGEEAWHLSAKGQAWARGLGLKPAPLKPCLDWTERRFHIAGPFAGALMRYLLDSGALRRASSGRGLDILDWSLLENIGVRRFDS